MKYLKALLVRELVAYFEDDMRRIEHALSVMRFAEEKLSDCPNADYDVVIASALLHDIGIRISEQKHGYNNGKTQEEYGPPIAEKLLSKIHFPFEKIQMVKEIIGNHHSPSKYDYEELKILKEADAIVNKMEK